MTPDLSHSNFTQKQLQELLVYPREAPDIELKGWLDLTIEDDRANLAKAILAIANSGGGYIILGYSEDAGDWEPDEQRPSDLSNYRQDIVDDIVQSYADPPFHCEVHHVSPLEEVSRQLCHL